MAEVLPLSLPEREDLAGLERIVERGLSTFTEVGCALLAIRDRRLYRGSFTTFEAYCLARWTITKTHANRLIQAHGVVSSMTPVGVIPPPNERQARPLVGLDPDDAAEAMEEARETASSENRPVTAKDVDVAALARKAGIDPARLARPPEDHRAKAVARIKASCKRIAEEQGRLDSGEQEELQTWLEARPGWLKE